MKKLYIGIALCIGLYSIVNIPRFQTGEILSTITFIATLCVAWFLFKKDLTGMVAASMILGAAIEFLTAAYWDYHLSVYLFRKISLFVIMGWGYSITFFILISNTVFKKVTGRETVPAFDPRILLIDMVVGPVWFIANELIAMKILHLWEYSECSGWHIDILGFGYPLEALIAVVLFSLVFPTFVRHWGKRFTLSVEHYPV
jgi:hypothetical protein